MDESFLIKDVLGVIFSFNPGQYSTFVQLCRGMKDLLKSFDMNGWDALIAQGCSVEIDEDEITWKKNGKWHRSGDLPAITNIYYGELYWYYNGELHRDNGPAIIHRLKKNPGPFGSPSEWLDKYFRHGRLHREIGPAVVNVMDNRLEWYINGKLHRDDGPAIVQPGRFVEYYKNGKRHRTDGPAFISLKDNNMEVRWYINDVLCDNNAGFVAYHKNKHYFYAVYKKQKTIHVIPEDNPWNGRKFDNKFAEQPAEFNKWMAELEQTPVEDYIIEGGSVSRLARERLGLVNRSKTTDEEILGMPSVSYMNSLLYIHNVYEKISDDDIKDIYEFLSENNIEIN